MWLFVFHEARWGLALALEAARVRKRVRYWCHARDHRDEEGMACSRWGLIVEFNEFKYMYAPTAMRLWLAIIYWCRDAVPKRRGYGRLGRVGNR